MSAGMPELGSKISLISKADIRYEGRLFTVDPQECTIALASVRSFGTEDRDTQYPVPAQSQVYDYILFRGSDIKDIRVVNNNPAQPLNDPAIMQVSVPPSLGAPQFQQHLVLGHVGATPMSQFGPYGLGGINMGAGTSGLQASLGGLTGSSTTSKLNDLIGGPDDSSRPQDLINSRSTTPASVRSRKSSVDQGTQAGGHQRTSSGGRKHVKPIQPPRSNQHRARSRERQDSQGRVEHQDNRQASPYQNRRPQHMQQYQNRPNHYQNQRGYHHQQQGYQNHQQGYQNQQQHRGGWVNRGPHMQRGRGRPHPRGGYMRPNQQGNQHNRKTLKFDSEYDFEQANTEFEELRSKLAKAKLDDTASTKSADGVANGIPETDKKDDSGNETCAGDTEQEEEHEIFYDKTKSFFDKISCEAVERAKGKTPRTDWRQERKLNSETFGVASARRGFYRGRGNFRGGFRGNYRGGYRYPQQQRGSNHQQQQRSEPENPTETVAPTQ